MDMLANPKAAGSAGGRIGEAMLCHGPPAEPAAPMRTTLVLVMRSVEGPP